MKITQIELSNFRCFPEKKFTFDSSVNLIIGNNTSGKTSILEALSVSMGAFLLGIPASYAGVTRKAHIRNLDDSDIHRYFSQGKEVIQTEFANDVSVKAKGFISASKAEVSWERTLKGLGSRPNNANCKKIQETASKLYESSNKDTGSTLPILMHYGTGRLWAGQNTKIKHLANTNTALGYYYGLKPDAQNKLLMPWIQKMYEISRDRDETLSILKCVYNTIIEFIPGCTRCYFSREHDELTLAFDDKEYPFSILSDGQRNIITLVGDIAMRCAHLNQHLGINAASETPGIVLVDEIDANIHPTWQKNLIPQIKKHFTNIQFVFTTHSPYIIQSIKEGKIINLDEKIDCYGEDYAWKKSIEEVSAELMYVETQRSKEFEDMMDASRQYYELLDNNSNSNGEKLEELSDMLNMYEERFSNDATFVALLRAKRREKGV